MFQYLKSFLFLVLLGAASVSSANSAVAIFAGGCFWCMQPPYDKTPGVIKTIAGYTGGELKNPSYSDVSSGKTSHREAVKIIYDPNKVSYQKLLDIFWRNVDPTDSGGQFCDRGLQYTTAIFATTDAQKKAAIISKNALIKSKKISPVVTPILDASEFFPAEEYHQNYYKKNPLRYRFYRYNCGRDARLKDLWQ